MAELSNRAAFSVGDRLRESLFYFPLILGGIILLPLLMVVLFGPLLAPYNPYLVDRIVIPHYDSELGKFIRVPLLPSLGFPLGTDERGMDILTLLMFGARTTLIATFLVAGGRILIGLVLGMVTGWNENKWIDRVVMGLINVLTSVPALIAALILVYSLGITKGMPSFVLALTVMGWTEVAQYMRSEVLVLRKMPFIEGAQVVGARGIDVLLRHIFPNILPQLFVLAFLEVGAVLMLVGELALLGVFIGGGSTLDLSDVLAPPVIVGIPTLPEWGAMVASGFRYFRSNPHVVMFPAAAIFLAVFGFNSCGEGLRAFFEKRGVKATFLLSRNFLWGFLTVIIAVALILNSTSPALWFREMASQFRGERASMDAAALEPLWHLPADDAGVFPAAQALADVFRENDLKGGIRWSNFIYARDAAYRASRQPPFLEILDTSGAVIARFESSQEIGYVIDDYGRGGDAIGNVLAIRFPGEMVDETIVALENADLEGKIILLREGNAGPWTGRYFAERKASGIIWVAGDDTPITNAPLYVAPRRASDAPTVFVPVLRISAEVADQILQSSELVDSADQFSTFEIKELETRVHFEVLLDEPEIIHLNSVAAYRQGTDADLGDEIVLFFVNCNGMWSSASEIAIERTEENQCPVPYLTEASRLLNEFLIDTRRPVMFVVWGGAEFGDGELTSWLTNPDSFSLSAPGLPLRPHVTIMIQLMSAEDETDQILYEQGSHPELVDLIENAGRRFGAPVAETSSPIGLPFQFPQQFWPFQAVLEVSPNLSSEDSNGHGEALIFTLIRLVRETILNAD